MTMRTGPTTVLFVCLHGSAKSLIAAHYFTRLARSRGLAYVGQSAGLEPDAAVPDPVIDGLGRDGFDVAGYAPGPATPDRLADADYVVSLGCELPIAANVTVKENWDDLPMVSDGFEPARDAIIKHVTRLVDSLT